MGAHRNFSTEEKGIGDYWTFPRQDFSPTWTDIIGLVYITRPELPLILYICRNGHVKYLILIWFERRHLIYPTANWMELIGVQQGVALTGRNRTGPPYSVDRPAVADRHAPGGRPARRQRYRRRQTPASKTILAH